MLKTYIKNHLLIFSSLCFVVGVGIIYLIIHNIQHVEARVDFVTVEHTISEEVPAESTKFVVSFERSSKNEQQMYNTILTQTTAVLDILSDAGVAPTEYDISYITTPPENNKGQFKMVQTINVTSQNVGAAEKSFIGLQKTKNVQFSGLEYGFSDLRPVTFNLNNKVLEEARLKAESQIEEAGNEPVGIKSINGNEDIAIFNPSPLHLNEESDKEPYYLKIPDGTKDFNSTVPMSASVKIEYYFE